MNRCIQVPLWTMYYISHLALLYLVLNEYQQCIAK